MAIYSQRTQNNRLLTPAVEFLLDQQCIDGAWREFDLDVGPSTSWATSFTLLCLSYLDQALLGKRRVEAKVKAAKFLIANKRPSGGWGYNENVREDCDSTAYGILALRTNGFVVSTESYAHL